LDLGNRKSIEETLLKLNKMQKLSLFDLPNITEIVSIIPTLKPIYNEIKHNTLGHTDKPASLKLYNLIKHRLELGKPFLGTKTESHVLNIVVNSDELYKYAQTYQIRSDRVSLIESDKVVSHVGAKPGTCLLILSKDTMLAYQSTNIISKTQFKNVVLQCIDDFTFFIDDWLNVHLASRLTNDMKDNKEVLLAKSLFNVRSTLPGLFSGASSDGNITNFCSHYRISIQLKSCEYSLVTVKLLLPKTKQDFCTLYPKQSNLFSYLTSSKSEVSFVIRSDKCDRLLPHSVKEMSQEETVFDFLYLNVVEVPNFQERRRYTFMIMLRCSFDIVSVKPWIDDYNSLRQHVNHVSRGSRILGIVANKASGKSTMIRLVDKNHHVCIDSDLYGQILTFIMFNNYHTRPDKIFTGKDNVEIRRILLENTTIIDGKLELTGAYESLFETLANEFIRDNDVRLEPLLSGASIGSHLTKFDKDFKSAVALFPYNSYYYNITEVATTLMKNEEKFSSLSRIIVFAHFSYELYSLLGGNIFTAQFPSDENFAITARARQANIASQVLLQRYYEQCEVRLFNAIPALLILVLTGVVA